MNRILRRDIMFALLLGLATTARTPAAAHATADPSAAIEMYRQERAKAAVVTIADIESFVSRVHWTSDDGMEARIIAHAAGNSGKKEFRPALKRAAEDWSKAGFKSLTFCALHNLWKLGEPPEYFLENVRQYKRNPELALHSAIVWGRDATEQSLVELTQIKDETPLDSPIRNWAYPLVRGAVHYYEQYAALRSMEDKVDMVLSYAGGGWSPLTGKGSDPLSVPYPEIYWARRELLVLCKKDPELVAHLELGLELGL